MLKNVVYRRSMLCLVLALMALLLSSCACGHSHTEVRAAVEADCRRQGYTGDIWCSDCDKMIEQGTTVPLLEHVKVMREEKAATCTELGYSGDTVCARCGLLLAKGSVIMWKHHDWGELVGAHDPTCDWNGYTGWRKCNECGADDYGNAIRPIGHEYADNRCVRCGWPEPGLYMDGELAFTWPELVENGYVTVRDTKQDGVTVPTLTYVVHTMTGKLVVDNSVRALAAGNVSKGPGVLKDTGVEELYLPASITKLSSYSLAESPALTTVHVYGQRVEFGYYVFAGCPSLTSVDFVNEYSKFSFGAASGMFMNCTALETFTVAPGVKQLPSYMFAGCTALKEVILPDGLKELWANVFRDCTALEQIQLPASLEKLHSEVFKSSGIRSLDLSQTRLTDLDREVFAGCTALESVTLPETLKYMGYQTFRGCTGLTSVNWPGMVVRGSSLGDAVNLRFVHYTGTDAKRRMIDTSMLPVGAIVYQGELVETDPASCLTVTAGDTVYVDTGEQGYIAMVKSKYLTRERPVGFEGLEMTVSADASGVRTRVHHVGSERSFQAEAIPVQIRVEVPAHTKRYVLIDAQLRLETSIADRARNVHVRLQNDGEQPYGDEMILNMGGDDHGKDLRAFSLKDSADRGERTVHDLLTADNRGDEAKTFTYYLYVNVSADMLGGLDQADAMADISLRVMTEQ